MKYIAVTTYVIALCLFTAPSRASGLDIDTSSPFIYPEYSKTISMDFQDAPLVDVLKIFSKQSRLNLVASQEISKKTVTVYLENVPVEQALEQILRANDLTYEIQPGSDIYIVKPIKKPEVELVTRIYQLKNAAVSSAAINSLLKISTGEGGSSESSSKDNGINETIKKILTKDGKISEDPRTNSLIITDIATNFPMIEQTITRLDVNVPQILIEVEMIEVAKSVTDKLGIKWGDTPLILTGGTMQTVFPWDGSFPAFNEVGNVEYLDQPRLTAGLINASGFSATLNFLRTQGDTKNLARPRILTLNNQTAQIKISTDEAIGEKTTNSGTTDTTMIQTSEAERAETGVILTVTPQANLETREITMALVPTHTLAKAGISIGGTTFKDPETRTASALFKVMDGSTIVIGGLLREETTTTLTKVPLLGDIPILGAAFRHKETISQERELLIFITPHIVDDAVARSSVAKKLIREQDLPTQVKD